MANNDKQAFRLFLGCFIALVATAFAFSVRAAILDSWGQQFDLSEEQKGVIQGVGLYPFAISIILFSLIIDRIGYGVAMVFAFIAHTVSAILTIFAGSFGGFTVLYFATFLFALGNGIVEAVINPVVATMYPNNKTHYLNILHAGWPGGLVIGGLLAIAVGMVGSTLGKSLPGSIWQWQMAVVLIPTIAYGIILFGMKFPVQERVEAGVTYMEMLKEFGWGSCYICSFLLVMAISQVLSVLSLPIIPTLWAAAIAVIPTILFAIYVKSFGRPMFVLLLLVMFLLATTELGTDSWISDIMKATLRAPGDTASWAETKGTLFLVYTSLIMFILRFFAGPIVHRISPLGLLAVCAAIAAAGLTWLSAAGNALGMLFLAATLYGFGKTFFWPTTLGVVSEQYPKGGALMLNAIAGVGMIAVGTLGNPLIGTVQDHALVPRVEKELPEVASALIVEAPGVFGNHRTVKASKLDELLATANEAKKAELEAAKAKITAIQQEVKQQTLGKIAVLPAIMCVCYLGLIVYFRSKGGYQAEVLTGHAAEDEEFTGGVEGPVE